MKRILIVFALFLLSLRLLGQPIISTVVGNGTSGFGGDGGAATSANLGNPRSVVVDGSGNLYIADTWNQRIRKVNSSGIISTIAGTGTAGYSGDGGAATTATLNHPTALCLDPSGNLYITDADNNVIRKINTSGIISTYAGTGVFGYSGDGGAATSAKLYNPTDVVYSSGNLYIADCYNARVRKVNSSGIINTVAGTGTIGFSGDGGAATSAQLTAPGALAIDGAGNLYIGDLGAVRKVNTSGIINTVIGTGSQSCSGNGGNPTSATVNTVYGIALDSYGNLFICDVACSQVREVNTTGTTIVVFAGTGTIGYSGDGGAAASAMIAYPYKISFNSSNEMYIADASNSRIRKVTKPNCTASGGSNVSDQNTSCCGCSTSGVQIGSVGVTGLTYSWSPSTNLSSTTVAQPTSTWCNVATPKTYTISVSGANCVTSNAVVTVSTTPYGGSNCCRLNDSLNVSNSSFNVYPDPSDGHMSISIDDDAEFIRVYNLTGEMILEQVNNPKGTVALNISTFGSGIYLVLISTKSGIQTKKIIVE